MRQISSAMSVGVTEPNSEPVGPALTSKRSTVLPSVLRDLGGLLGAPRLVPRALGLDPLRARRRAPGVATSASLPRQQEVAGVAARDVDDLAAEAELLDVLEQDDLHRL